MFPPLALPLSIEEHRHGTKFPPMVPLFSIIFPSSSTRFVEIRVTFIERHPASLAFSLRSTPPSFLALSRCRPLLTFLSTFYPTHEPAEASATKPSFSTPARRPFHCHPPQTLPLRGARCPLEAESSLRLSDCRCVASCGRFSGYVARDSVFGPDPADCPA